MAINPQGERAPIEQSFLADRALFWNRFTTFTKYVVGGIAVLLLGLLLFVYR